MSDWDSNSYDGSNAFQPSYGNFDMGQNPFMQDFQQQPQQPSFDNNMDSQYGIQPSQLGGDYQQPTANDFSQPSFYERLQQGIGNINMDPSTRPGLTNVMRGGQAATGLLGTYLQMQENKKARKAQENAMAFMKSQMDPNADRWGGQLESMLANPSGYLTDPVDQANAQNSQEQAMRMAQRQGRSSLTRDEMLNIQNVKQNSYQTRLKQLADLYGKSRQNNMSAATAMGGIMSKAPQGDTQAIQGALKGLWSAGRGITDASGATTTQQQPRNTTYSELI